MIEIGRAIKSRVVPSGPEVSNKQAKKDTQFTFYTRAKTV